jgi:hypothetical protein
VSTGIQVWLVRCGLFSGVTARTSPSYCRYLASFFLWIWLLCFPEVMTKHGKSHPKVSTQGWQRISQKIHGRCQTVNMWFENIGESTLSRVKRLRCPEVGTQGFFSAISSCPNFKDSSLKRAVYHPNIAWTQYFFVFFNLSSIFSNGLATNLTTNVVAYMEKTNHAANHVRIHIYI